MCKSSVSNQQRNEQFIASVKTANYDLKNWHVIECPSTIPVLGIIGTVVLAVWLKKKFLAKCNNRPRESTAPQEEAPPVGAMRPNPRFALEFLPQTQPQFLPSTTIAPQSAQWHNRGHQEVPPAMEGASVIENRDVLAEMRWYS